jgi:hypothetical protein
LLERVEHHTSQHRADWIASALVAPAHTATSQQEPARIALSAAMALCRDMDMTFWLPQAEAVLVQAE